jgi:SAM-dependent methyltransferase
MESAGDRSRVMSGRPYLDYYIDNKIIPVRQDLSDFVLHMKRRSILYQFLKIPPAAVRHQKVLEIGPGTGDNATYTASLLPRTYVLVDGNPYSISALRERVADPQYMFSRIPDLQIVNCDFLAYADERRFDLVLCEGLIPGQGDAAGFLRRAASFVDSDGLLVMTTISAVSLLSEVCRRLIKPVLARRSESPEDLFERLQAFFAPHLQTLPGRSRVVGDWVNDSILQTWTRQAIFTIEDAITAIGDEFQVFGTSPQFIQDFRWYKAAALDRNSINDLAIEQASFWAPLFIDYRIGPDDIHHHDGAGLERECMEILVSTHQAWKADDPAEVEACVDLVERFGQRIAHTIPRTAASVRDFVSGMRSLLRNETADFGDFESWFGRGQQYVSFLRRPSPSPNPQNN